MQLGRIKERGKAPQRAIFITVIAVIGIGSCGGGGGDGPAPPSPSPEPPPPSPPPPVFAPGTSFTNISAFTGITHSFSIATLGTADPAEIGGGLAAADVDRDGDIDLYFVGGDGDPNALYRNDGANQFTDISIPSGLNAIHLGRGPAFGDIDSDVAKLLAVTKESLE